MKKINIAQLIPQDICLSCDVCCRYAEQFSIWTPFVLKEEVADFETYDILPGFMETSCGTNIRAVKNNGIYACPFFNKDGSACAIYNTRPFDCQLYPFVISYSQDYAAIILAADCQCPYIAGEKNATAVIKHAAALRDIIEKEEIATLVYENKGLIMNHADSFHPFFRLDRISHKVFGESSGLKVISAKDRELFRQFFQPKKVRLFSHTFEYIYSWQDLAYIFWNIVDDNLLVFWRQADDFFLLIPPMGKEISSRAMEYSRQLCKDIGGLIIENAIQEDTQVLKQYGLRTKVANHEYICDRQSLISLRGDKFKSARWSYNYFNKNFKAKIRKFGSQDTDACLKLYDSWAQGRLNKYQDRYYRLLLEDSFFSQRRLMLEFDFLKLRGEVVEIDDRISAYSLGYPIDDNCFCVCSEVADLQFKGISEFVFREFCRELVGFKFVNLMDDSGLANLKRKKLSYLPSQVNPIYTCRLF